MLARVRRLPSLSLSSLSIPLIRCYDACTADSTSTERLNEKSDAYSLAKNLPAIHAPMKYFLSPSFPVVRWTNVSFFHRRLSPWLVPVVCAHSCAAPPFLYFTFYGYTLTRNDAQIGGTIRRLRSFVVLAFALRIVCPVSYISSIARKQRVSGAYLARPCRYGVGFLERGTPPAIRFKKKKRLGRVVAADLFI